MATIELRTEYMVLLCGRCAQSGFITEHFTMKACPNCYGSGRLLMHLSRQQHNPWVRLYERWAHNRTTT